MWGDIESAIEQLDNNLMDIDGALAKRESTKFYYKRYDLQAYLQFPQQEKMKKSINLNFQLTDQPFILKNEEYYRFQMMLNREQFFFCQRHCPKEINWHAHPIVLVSHRWRRKMKDIYRKNNISNAYMNI
jgi:hypothetical protein